MATDADVVARWIYDRTMCSIDWPPGPAELLQRLVGASRIAFDAAPLRVSNKLGGLQVTIPRGLPPERLCMAMAWATATAGLWMRQEVGSERHVRRVAWAIVMPKPALRRTIRAIGPRIEAIARAFVVPPTDAYERVALAGLRLSSGVYQIGDLRSAG